MSSQAALDSSSSLERGGHASVLCCVDEPAGVAVGRRDEALRCFIFDSGTTLLKRWSVENFPQSKRLSAAACTRRRERKCINFELLFGGADEQNRSFSITRAASAGLAKRTAHHHRALCQVAARSGALDRSSRMSLHAAKHAPMVMNLRTKAPAMSRAMVVCSNSPAAPLRRSSRAAARIRTPAAAAFSPVRGCPITFGWACAGSAAALGQRVWWRWGSWLIDIPGVRTAPMPCCTSAPAEGGVACGRSSCHRGYIARLCLNLKEGFACHWLLNPRRVALLGALHVYPDPRDVPLHKTPSGAARSAWTPEFARSSHPDACTTRGLYNGFRGRIVLGLSLHEAGNIDTQDPVYSGAALPPSADPAGGRRAPQGRITRRRRAA